MEDTMDDKIKTVAVPSVVGVGSMDAGGLTLANVAHGRSGLKNRPARVAFDGVEYLVGHNVEFYARPIERMDFARFVDGPELRALLYATLHQSLGDGQNRIALAIGLPVEMLQDKFQAASIEAAMTNWMVGQHRFAVDDLNVEFEIVGLRAKIAQPVATWFDWGLDLNGQWARGRVAIHAPVLVIDHGFNTLDLVAVDGGQISTRYTSGDTLGMRRAAEMTAENVRRQHNVELSLHEADDLVRSALSNKKAQIYVQGELVDVTAQVRQAINSLATDVVRFIERSVGTAGKFKVLLTGGGALALAARLTQQFRHAEVVPDAVTANARGLAKLARRPGFLVKADEEGAEGIRLIGLDPGFGAVKCAEVVAPTPIPSPVEDDRRGA
jgi:hypothetical protein